MPLAMAAIERIGIEAAVGTARLWAEVAQAVRRALAQRGVSPRDTLVLLPYAALLAPARAEFARCGGWQPRIETPNTLAAALGPPLLAEPGQLSGDAVLDQLQAEQLLNAVLPAQAAIDRRHAAALVAQAAQTLAQVAAEQLPAERESFWRLVREQTATPSRDGIGGADSALLAGAAAWAAGAGEPSSDRLYTLAAMSAVVVVRVGGVDGLAERVLQAAGRGGWLIDLDLQLATAEPPLPLWATAWQRWVADDFEDEAMAVASSVIEALAAGAERVAVVALDRVLSRRAVALLARRGVAVSDETGWRLSTTPAAARLIARLRAMPATASQDAVLDWLKTWPTAQRHGSAVDTLETRWRGTRSDIGSVSAGEALWRDAEDCRAQWQHATERALRGWLSLLLEQLQREQASDTMRDHPDAVQLLQRLQQLHDDPAAAAASTLVIGLPAFTRWVETVCEGLNVQPPLRPARVVLAPLSRVIARLFDHVVLAGADEHRLGAIEPTAGLIGEALASRLGLPTAARTREDRRLALAQLVRVPAVTITWRLSDGDEPLAAGPDLQAIEAWVARSGQPLPAAQRWRARQQGVALRASQRPLPTAAQALPERLSATAIDTLRACPYRFYARSVLRLAQAEEFDVAAGKREFGEWLHEALHRFHQSRSGSDDAAELLAAADAAIETKQLDRSELLPFRAGVEAFVPAYLRWQADREAEGWRWHAGEEPRTIRPPEWAPQFLEGRIDRVDRSGSGALQVIDYKTGSYDGLRRRVAAPLEDTQLSCYAALLQGAGDDGTAVSAAYLALDDRKGPRLVMHADVARSAAVLVDALGDELRRLRDGAALPALGEGEVCLTCEMRGLCRRDHWSDAGGGLGGSG